MKILHITIVRKLTGGQTKQLTAEHDASSKLQGASWTTMAFHDHDSELEFITKVPAIFRFPAIRNLYGWYKAINYSKKYDYVLLRHMTFDPFCFIFSPFMRNRISVHHAKEVEELKLIRKGWKGNLASVLERLSGPFSLRRAVSIIGVTGEISEYEKDRSNADVPTLIYPNGINNENVYIADDNRRNSLISIAFICGTFSPWHGLDKLINSVSNYMHEDIELIHGIYLIGTVPDIYVNRISNDERLKKIFKLCGYLTDKEYKIILNECDIGLSSFALERENLLEACTLKVRELLASGIPVYSGHKDCALPDSFPYYKKVEEIDISDLINFGFQMKNISRAAVAFESIQYISKLHIMERLVNSIRARSINR